MRTTKINRIFNEELAERTFQTNSNHLKINSMSEGWFLQALQFSIRKQFFYVLVILLVDLLFLFIMFLLLFLKPIHILSNKNILRLIRI